MSLEIKNILVPTDFSENSKKAITYAIEFSKKFGSKLHLIFVIEPVFYPSDLGLSQIPVFPINTGLNIKAEENLVKFSEEFIQNDIKFDYIIKTGKPFIEIISAANEIMADLIIISTHGHSGFEQIIFGSTAEKVVRKSDIPVLTIRCQKTIFETQKIK